MKLLGSRTKFEEVGLGGRVLTVSVGCINKKTDKDDAWWYALACKYDNIYDIGANVGYSSLMATLQIPDKRILLADPNPLALKLAKENLERNNLSVNKTYVNAFAGAQKGEQVKFYTLGAGSAGSMFGSHADSAKAVNAFYMVDTTTLDDMVAEAGWMPELVKIDVEAAESYVLAGAKELAAKQNTVFMVEMHAPPEMPMVKNANLILDWCSENRYTAYYLKEHAVLHSAEQIAHRGRCHLLLLPEGMEYPDYLKEISEGDDVDV